MRNNPVYEEKCGACGHIQAHHLGLSKDAPGYLDGRSVPCRREDCPCGKWEPTWGVAR